MANADNPNGFTPFSASPRVTAYNCVGTVTKGDMLAYGTGGVELHDGTNKQAAGVAAHSGQSGETLLVWDDPTTVFIGQCEGTHDADTHDGGQFDIQGATGEQVINQGASADNTVTIIRQEFVPGHNEAGAHARVLFTITEHVHGGNLT